MNHRFLSIQTVLNLVLITRLLCTILTEVLKLANQLNHMFPTCIISCANTLIQGMLNQKPSRCRLRINKPVFV